MQRFIDDLLVKRETCPIDNEYDGEKWELESRPFLLFLWVQHLAHFFQSYRRSIHLSVCHHGVFIAKYFGSGVIVATGFIHLLEPASDSLGEECLGGTFVEYPWAFGIALMSLFAMFFIELISFHYIDLKIEKNLQRATHIHISAPQIFILRKTNQTMMTDWKPNLPHKLIHTLNTFSMLPNTKTQKFLGLQLKMWTKNIIMAS